jgi:hypothetical protein
MQAWAIFSSSRTSAWCHTDRTCRCIIQERSIFGRVQQRKWPKSTMLRTTRKQSKLLLLCAVLDDHHILDSLHTCPIVDRRFDHLLLVAWLHLREASLNATDACAHNSGVSETRTIDKVEH